MAENNNVINFDFKVNLKQLNDNVDQANKKIHQLSKMAQEMGAILDSSAKSSSESVVKISSAYKNVESAAIASIRKQTEEINSLQKTFDLLSKYPTKTGQEVVKMEERIVQAIEASNVSLDTQLKKLKELSVVVKNVTNSTGSGIGLNPVKTPSSVLTTEAVWQAPPKVYEQVRNINGQLVDTANTIARKKQEALAQQQVFDEHIVALRNTQRIETDLLHQAQQEQALLAQKKLQDMVATARAQQDIDNAALDALQRKLIGEQAALRAEEAAMRRRTALQTQFKDIQVRANANNTYHNDIFNGVEPRIAAAQFAKQVDTHVLNTALHEDMQKLLTDDTALSDATSKLTQLTQTYNAEISRLIANEHAAQAAVKADEEARVKAAAQLAHARASELTSFSNNLNAQSQALQHGIAVQRAIRQQGHDNANVNMLRWQEEERQLTERHQRSLALIQSRVTSGRLTPARGLELSQSFDERYRSRIMSATEAMDAHMHSINNTVVASRNLFLRIAEIMGIWQTMNFVRSGIVNAISSIPTVGIELDAVRASLTATTYSSAGAGSVLKALGEEAQRTGIAISTLRESFAQFHASTSLSGESLSTTMRMFKNIDSTITSLHINADKAKGIFNALAQMFNKSKVQSEELVKQLGNLLPGAFAAFARSNFKTPMQLSQEMRKGLVFAHDTIDKFTAYYAEKFSTAFGQASTGLNSNIGRMQTSFDNLGQAIYETSNGAMNSFVKGVASINGYLLETVKGTTGLSSVLSIGLNIALSTLVVYLGKTALALTLTQGRMLLTAGVARGMGISVMQATIAMQSMTAAATAQAAGLGLMRGAWAFISSPTVILAGLASIAFYMHGVTVEVNSNIEAIATSIKHYKELNRLEAEKKANGGKVSEKTDFEVRLENSEEYKKQLGQLATAERQLADANSVTGKLSSLFDITQVGAQEATIARVNKLKQSVLDAKEAIALAEERIHKDMTDEKEQVAVNQLELRETAEIRISAAYNRSFTHDANRQVRAAIEDYNQAHNADLGVIKQVLQTKLEIPKGSTEKQEKQLTDDYNALIAKYKQKQIEVIVTKENLAKNTLEQFNNKQGKTDTGFLAAIEKAGRTSIKGIESDAQLALHTLERMQRTADMELRDHQIGINGYYERRVQLADKIYEIETRATARKREILQREAEYGQAAQAPMNLPTDPNVKMSLKYDDIVNEASKKYGVRVGLINGIIGAENPNRIPDLKNPDPKSTATGIMQLTKATASTLGVKNVKDPYDNIMGGTKYLAQLLKTFGNEVDAAMAYNAGAAGFRAGNGSKAYAATVFKSDKAAVNAMKGDNFNADKEQQIVDLDNQDTQSALKRDDTKYEARLKLDELSLAYEKTRQQVDIGYRKAFDIMPVETAQMEARLQSLEQVRTIQAEINDLNAKDLTTLTQEQIVARNTALEQNKNALRQVEAQIDQAGAVAVLGESNKHIEEARNALQRTEGQINLDKQLGLHNELQSVLKIIEARREYVRIAETQLAIEESITNKTDKQIEDIKHTRDEINAVKYNGAGAAQAYANTAVPQSVQAFNTRSVELASGQEAELNANKDAQSALGKQYEVGPLPQEKVSEILKQTEDLEKKKSDIVTRYNRMSTASHLEMFSGMASMGADSMMMLEQSAAKAYGAQSSQARAAFVAYKMLKMSEVIMETASLAMKLASSEASIPLLGIALAPVGVAMAVGMGAVQLAAIASAPMPQAHAGLTDVPQDQTYLLKAGERVLAPEQNKDFKQMMKDVKGVQSQQGNRSRSMQGNNTQMQAATHVTVEPKIKILNLGYADSFADFLSSSAGEQIVLNHMHNNGVH